MSTPNHRDNTVRDVDRADARPLQRRVVGFGDDEEKNAVSGRELLRQEEQKMALDLFEDVDWKVDEKKQEEGYFVPSDNIRAKLVKNFPFLKWPRRWGPGVHFPQNPFFVGEYHQICMVHNFNPDIDSDAFSWNQFDEEQFEFVPGQRVLCLQPGEFFYASKIENNLAYIGDYVYPVEFDVFELYTSKNGSVYTTRPAARRVLCQATQNLKIRQKLVNELIHISRGQPRSEDLRKSLVNKFSFVCRHFKVDPADWMPEFDTLLKEVWEHDDYVVIPYDFVGVILKKMPQSFMTPIISVYLRRFAKQIDLNARVAEFISQSKDGGRDLSLFIQNLIADHMNFEGFAMTLGQVVYDVCGEHLCDKKVTYEVHALDINAAMLKLCQPRLAYVCVGPTFFGYEPQVSRTCVHNTLNALQTRFVAENTAVGDEMTRLDILQQHIMAALKDTATSFYLMTYVEFIESMSWSAAMKKQAYSILPEIEGHEEAWLDTKVRAFAKWEELKQKGALNSRLIQGFSVGFSLITGRVVKSLYKYLKAPLGNPNSSICVGSMMTNEDIGIWQNLNNTHGLLTIDLDGSAYDATTRLAPVEFLYRLYEGLAGEHLIGIETLRKSLKITGSLFTHGIKYSLPNELYDSGWAPMASGRADTTLTNSLLRLSEGLWYLHKAKTTGRVIASGDDLRLCVQEPIHEDDLSEWGSELGRGEKIETNFRDEGVFLRKRFYPVGNQLIPGVQIGRAISKMCWISSKVSAKNRLSVLRGDAIGRLATDGHVPIVREFSERMLEFTSGKRVISQSQYNNREWIEHETTHEYDENTLMYVAHLYGCTLDDVHDCIQYVRTFDLEGDFDHWLLQRMFEQDVGTPDPIEHRHGMVYGDISPPQPPATMAVALTPEQTNWLYWFFIIAICAPIVEEITKTFLVLVLGYTFLSSALLIFIPVLCIALLESKTPFGFFIPDTIARFVGHFLLSLISARYLPLGILVHAIHNASCFYGGFGPLFFVTVTSSIKMACNLAYAIIFIEKKADLRFAFPEVIGPIDAAKRWVIPLYWQPFPWEIWFMSSLLGMSVAQGKEQKTLPLPLLDEVQQFIRQSKLDTSMCALATSCVCEAFWILERYLALVATAASHKHREVAVWISTFAMAQLLRLRKYLCANKKTTKRGTAKSSRKQKTNPRKMIQKEASLGRQLLSLAGSSLGSLAGPAGAAVGNKIAGWTSDILGMGDYEIKSNTMVADGVPTFGGTTQNVRIKHREFLGDVTGSVGFRVFREYRINPALSSTFPWLSRVATNFQSYQMKGLVFEFVSTSADALNSVNTALGTVVMATQYNANAPDFLNKAEMEQYEFSCSTRPSCSLMHPVECDPSQNVMNHLYVRVPEISVPAGQTQFYDLGVFQLATVGMQAEATIGELWVTYDVEFFKPRISAGGTWPGQAFHASNLLPDSVNTLGPIQRPYYGELPLKIGFDGVSTIEFPDSIAAGFFLVSITYPNGLGTNVFPTLEATTSKIVMLNVFENNLQNYARSSSTVVALVQITGYLYGGNVLSVTWDGVAESVANVTVDVVAVPKPDYL